MPVEHHGHSSCEPVPLRRPRHCNELAPACCCFGSFLLRRSLGGAANLDGHAIIKLGSYGGVTMVCRLAVHRGHLLEGFRALQPGRKPSKKALRENQRAKALLAFDGRFFSIEAFERTIV